MKKCAILFLVFWGCGGNADSAKPDLAKSAVAEIFRQASRADSLMGANGVPDKDRRSVLDSIKRIPPARAGSAVLMVNALEESFASGGGVKSAFLSEAEKAERAERLKVLLGKFTEKKDDFRKLSFYNHKRFGGSWLNRRGLVAVVNSKGFIYLESNYYADNWIFHSSVTVLVDGKTYQTEVVPTYSEHNKTDNDSGKIWERVTYLDSQSVIKAIAENWDKEIKVRFNGREYYDDLTLSKEDKAAIRDCWELYSCIL